VSAVAARSGGEGAAQGSTLQGAAFGRKFGISAFAIALQIAMCYRKFIFIFNLFEH